MAEPRRIQRQRTKGWRMPEGAIYVGRPSRWGNRWRVGKPCDTSIDRSGRITAETATREFRAELLNWNHDTRTRWLQPLRGHDLACWCPLDQPCHGDVLLAMANG